MARRKMKKNEGVNTCCFAGEIVKWFEGSGKRPDLISLQVPYKDGEYSTRIPLTLWTGENEAYNYMLQNDIDVGDIIAVEAECTCPKATDYTPQFTVKSIELVRKKEG